MIRYVIITAASLLLMACAQAQETTQRSGKMIKREYSNTYYKVKEIFTPLPPKNTKERAAPSRYCYRVMNDIMCYKDPQAGAEMRLVGYQEPFIEEDKGDNASTQPPARGASQISYDMPAATMSPGMSPGAQTASFTLPSEPSMPMRSPFIKPGPMAEPGTVPELKAATVGAPPPIMTDSAEYSGEPRGLMRKHRR